MNKLLLQLISLLLLLLPLFPAPLTAQPPTPHPVRHRILHQPLFPATSSPPPPPSPSHDEPFFPEVPSYASPLSQPSPPPPPPSVPANAVSYGPIPTTTSQSSSASTSSSFVPTKIAIAVSVALVTLGMLSAFAFFLYRHQRRHLHPSPSDSRKLIAPPLPQVGFSQEDYGDDPPQPPNFLFLGTVEPSSAAGGNSDALKCSPYRKLNSGKRTEFGRYRPSPELTPLPPLVRPPPPDSVVRMMSSSEDEEEVVTGRRTETAFYSPQGSGVGNDEGYYTPDSRQSMRSVSRSDRSNSNGSGSGKGNTSGGNGGSKGNGNANHLTAPHSKRTSPRSRLSGSSPDMKHVIIPSIKQEVRPQNPRPRFIAPRSPPNTALLQPTGSLSPRTSKVSAPPPPPPLPPPLPPPPPSVPRPFVPSARLPAPKMEEIPSENREEKRLKSRGGCVSREDAVFSNGVKDADEIHKIAGGGSSETQNGDERDTGRPKLKPLHWDKVKATSNRVTVWDQIKSSSFQ